MSLLGYFCSRISLSKTWKATFSNSRQSTFILPFQRWFKRNHFDIFLIFLNMRYSYFIFQGHFIGCPQTWLVLNISHVQTGDIWTIKVQYCLVSNPPHSLQHPVLDLGWLNGQHPPVNSIFDLSVSWLKLAKPIMLPFIMSFLDHRRLCGVGGLFFCRDIP